MAGRAWANAGGTWANAGKFKARRKGHSESEDGHREAVSRHGKGSGGGQGKAAVLIFGQTVHELHEGAAW